MLWSLWGGQRKNWRIDPADQPPACSNSNERVPRTEGNLAFKSQGNTVPHAGGGNSQRTFTEDMRGWGSELTLPAALSGSRWMYLVFTRPSPDVTGRGIRHPCFFTNLRGATLMWICWILLWKGLVSAGDAFRQQCLSYRQDNKRGWRERHFIH